MAYNTPVRRRNPLPFIVAVVVGLVAVVGVYLVLRGGGDDDPGSAGSDRRSGCVALTISSSTEKSELLTELAGRYNKAGRTFADGKCADVKVYGKASGAGLTALSRGWDARRDGAPAPQVWAPASSSWVNLLRQELAGKDVALVPTGKIDSIAQTPLVIAMPRPMAQALGWPGKAIGWSDLLGLANNPRGWASVGHPEWGRFKLGKTNPHYSTSGLNATVGAYIAATGRSSDLTARDVANPKVQAFVKGVESSVVHYGDTTLTFLSNLAEADKRGQGLSYISAVAIEEKSVFDYNQGNPTGNPKLFGKGSKPRVPLVAVYPKEGTLLSDNPFVVLTTASDEQRAAATDFLAFVRQSDQQKRFTDLAFRGYNGKPGSVVKESNGLLPNQKYTVLDPPDPQVLAKAAAGWDVLRKRARVLLVLDVSGSMDQLVAGGKSKLELAKSAAVQALSQFSPDDQVGLWTFSTETEDNDKPYTDQVPIRPIKDNKAALESAIRGLHAEGGTALYYTTRSAQQNMLQAIDAQRINAVVVLTDGKNEYPRDNDLDGLLDDLDANNLENSVRIFPIAYGDKADLSVLQRIAAASRAAAYDASDPASIDNVLVAVLSNF